MVLGLESGPVTLIGLCNATLLKGLLRASSFVACWRKMFERLNIVSRGDWQSTLLTMIEIKHSANTKC